MMYGIYLPPGAITVVKGRYTVCLYDSQDEAESDLPRIRRKWGMKAYVDTATQNDMDTE